MGLRILANIIRNKEIVDHEVDMLMERYHLHWVVNYVPIINTMMEELSRVEINNAWFNGDYTRNFVEDCSAYDVVIGSFQMKLMNLTGCTSEESYRVCTLLYTLLQELVLDMDQRLTAYIRENHIDADTLVFNFMVEDVIGGQVGGEFYLVECPKGIYEILTEDNNWFVPGNVYRAGNLNASAAMVSSRRRW